MTTLEPFVDDLPIPPILEPLWVNPDGTPHYRVILQNGSGKLHRDLPLANWWGYQGMFPGPTFSVSSKQGIEVEFVNGLSGSLPFAIEPEEQGHHHHGGHVCLPEQPCTVVHLHGNANPPSSDGWSDDTLLRGQSITYHFPPHGKAALFWYHDHANMVTRLNVYAGLAGLYIVRDPQEADLGLPVEPPYEIPLVLQDRGLEVTIVGNVQTFTGRFRYQKLSSHDSKVWDHVLVNGKIAPKLRAEPCQYRLRVLNGSNSRIFRLKLLLLGADQSEATSEGMIQIGTDGGFLTKPVPLDSLAGNRGLTLAPAERADLLVNLQLYAGKDVKLIDTANGGADVLLFNVSTSSTRQPIYLPEKLSDPPVWGEVARTRRIGLYPKRFDMMEMHTINGMLFHDTVEELPEAGTVEIWEIYNFTADLHPMHVHQVNFEVLDRRSISSDSVLDPTAFDGLFRAWLGQDHSVHPLPGDWTFTSDPMAPLTNEIWPKDTVRVPSQQMTRIKMRFGPYTGRYMYHCHILEHEDMEMMRPFIVLPPTQCPQPQTPHPNILQ